mgnify:FL=1
MSIDPNLIPATLDLFHVVLGALVVILILLTLVLALLPFLAVKSRSRTVPEGEKQDAEKPVHEPLTGFQSSQPTAALQLLGLLQQEARFLDFIEEDIRQHSDSDIGAAVRVVHEGCRKAIREHVDIVPVRMESEGSRLTLESGFDPGQIRLTGNIVGSPPFSGVLIHRGWKATRIQLPLVSEGHDAMVLAPAEIEL